MERMPCVDCQALDRQLSSTEPHRAQKVVGSRKLPHPCKGIVQQYECATCGRSMIRDLDRNDDFARWEFGSL